jgi:ubiquinone/menaquinone biosynthesis C-methylase UbiE
MVTINPRTDRDYLTKEAYATDELLAIRYRTHELYSQPKVDFPRWVMHALSWRGDEWVLDVGAGPGAYFELVRELIPNGCLIAGDLSFGMARQARAAHPHVLNLDAQRLPFADHSFDMVLANHMLYHVPDLRRALDEISRVLRPDGCLIAATNSAETMPEFDTLARRACALLGYPKQKFRPAHSQFSLENGTVLLARHFRAVARYDLPSAFHFPEVEPVMAYLNSLQPLNAFQLPDDVSWEAFMDVMEKQVTRLIRAFGELEVHKLAGALVATNGGGFAAEYLRLLDTATV